jgi:hypothetical protein
VLWFRDYTTHHSITERGVWPYAVVHTFCGRLCSLPHDGSIVRELEGPAHEFCSWRGQGAEHHHGNHGPLSMRSVRLDRIDYGGRLDRRYLGTSRVRNQWLWSSASLLDMHRRGFYMSIYTIWTIQALGVGATIAAYVETTPHMGWRWIQWIHCMYVVRSIHWSTNVTNVTAV